MVIRCDLIVLKNWLQAR